MADTQSYVQTAYFTMMQSHNLRGKQCYTFQHVHAACLTSTLPVLTLTGTGAHRADGEGKPGCSGFCSRSLQPAGGPPFPQPGKPGPPHITSRSPASPGPHDPIVFLPLQTPGALLELKGQHLAQGNSQEEKDFLFYVYTFYASTMSFFSLLFQINSRDGPKVRVLCGKPCETYTHTQEHQVYSFPSKLHEKAGGETRQEQSPAAGGLPPFLHTQALPL